MTETSSGGSLMNIGDLAKPADTLIAKISEAIGGIAKPWQIKRVADAEAKAELIRAQAKIQISEIQDRALRRMIDEEGRKQENIENIVEKSLSYLKEDSKPEDVDPDWYVHFFERNRLISNTEMQEFWAKMLAQQANAPGSYSKRSIDLVATFEKSDFEIFTRFCTVLWFFPGLVPIVFNTSDEIYESLKITFVDLNHLEYLGLVTFNHVSGFRRVKLGKQIVVSYYNKILILTFQGNLDNAIEIGQVLLTKAGEELAVACGATPSEDFFMYVISRWIELGLEPQCPINTFRG